MNREEAMKILENGEWWDNLDEWYEVANPEFKKLHDAVDIALSALCTQQEAEQGCDKCSGIVYRQTTSGKIIPLEQRCGAKITPPCYQPDGDGCAYQIYGDNNDEPIDRCKRCPLCFSDKVRYQHKPETDNQVT